MAIPPEFAATGQPPLALVTGAARRIGAAFARALAADGFRVALHCHRSAAEAQALAAEIAAAGQAPPIVVAADLAQADCAERIFAQLPQVPHILVNNASIFADDSATAIDLALWDRQFAVNLRAPALLTQALATRREAAHKALVVNLTDAKLLAPNPDHFSYTLSKFGLAGLTRLAAQALAPNIRVNAIAPAVTLRSGPQSAANFAAAHVLNPLQRGVSTADLVHGLRYLVQTPTVTGQTLVIDSGQQFLALPRDVAYMVEP